MQYSRKSERRIPKLPVDQIPLHVISSKKSVSTKDMYSSTKSSNPLTCHSKILLLRLIDKERTSSSAESPNFVFLSLRSLR